MVSGAQADILIVIKTQMEKAKKDIKQYKERVSNMSKVSMRQFNAMENKVQKYTKLHKRLGNVMNQTRIEFQGWALSIMFFGMVLKRVFDMIWRSASKTFTDIKQSTEGAVSGFTMLDGAVKFLGFSLGAALEPVAIWLIPIVEKMANWVDQNQKLTATLVIAAGVLGTLLMVFGQLALAAFGFYDLGLKIGAIFSGPMFKGIAAALGGLSGGVILGIIAAVGAMWLAWETNLGNIRESVSNTVDILTTLFKNLFSSVKDIFSGLFKILKGIFTGDFDLLKEGFMQLMFGVVKALAALVDAGMDLIINALIGTYNIIKDLVFNIISLFLGSIKNMLEGLEQATGWDLGSAAVGDAMDWMDGLQTKLTAYVPERQGSLYDVVDALQDKFAGEQTINVNIDGEQVFSQTLDKFNSSA